MKQVLYYPRILIPNDWIKKTIMYSDKISSIYPYDVGKIEGEEEKLALSNMEYLKSQGVYEYTRPEDIDVRTHKNIHNNLLSVMDEKTLIDLRKKYYENKYSYAIYRSKMNDDTIRFLTESRIAKIDADPEFYNCILVEESVGLLYMSLLAYYSTKNKAEYTTSTDEVVHQSILFDKSNNLQDDYLLNLVLNDIPCPSPFSSIDDIMNFKNKRREDLIKFRMYLNDCIVRIQNGELNISSFRDEFENFSNDIQKMMKEDRIAIAVNALEIVIPPLAGVAVQSYFGDLDTNTISNTAGTLVSSFLINRIKSKFEINEQRKDNPLSYLYYAKREIC